MKSKTYRNINHKPKRPTYPLPLLLMLIVIYAALIIYGLVVLNHRTKVQIGQLNNGESTLQGFSRSLDLRIAAKNSYPSAPLSTVKIISTDNGIKDQLISFKVTDDNLTEYGLELLPATPKPPNGYPAVILCHGYASPTNYSTENSYLNDMVFYAQHGFAVIKPDFRGQGFSIHAGSVDSAYYSMNYNTDVMSLITSLKMTGNIDKANISLWGHSMGAYIALRAAVLSPDIRNLILLSGPVDSLSKMYLTFIPPSDENNLNALKTRQEVFSKYGIPAQNTAFWKYASPINLVSRIKAHIQINVGALDQTVPPEFSADLNSALNNANIKHDYFVYPDGDHSLSGQLNLVWQRSLQVLQNTETTPST